MTAGDAVLARARALIGVRFRLHGRDAAGGVDCVGLAGLALERGGLPGGYPLRSGDRARAEAEIARAGLSAGGAGPGDLLLMRSGPGQLHFAIANGAGEDCGAVHADAALRRVVERPGPLPWPIIGRWHLDEMEG